MTPVTPVVLGALAHPQYMFIQLFSVLSQPLLNFAHIFSQEDLCIFCFTNLQLYVLSCARMCVHVTMRAYMDLHSVQTLAHFVCLGSILSVQCAHLCTSQRCIFCAYCSYLWICKYCAFFAHFVTNLRQFVHHVSVQWQWILCTPNATKELSQGPFLELAQHNKWSVIK